MADLEQPCGGASTGPWHIALCALAAEVVPSPTDTKLDEGPAVLHIAENCLVSFPVTFEIALDRLAGLPRLFIEPDGALVWVGEHGEHSWQLDGVVYDRDGGVWYVELKGRCPRAALEQLAGLLGWPAAPVVVQLVQAGEWVTLEDFLNSCPS